MQQKILFTDIAKLLADSVLIDIATIKPTSRLIDELGLDSLDFLDVIFGIEKKFQIKFRNGEFEKLLRLDILLENNDPKGYIKEQDLAVLKPYLPILTQDTSIDPQKITPMALFSMITVESLLIATSELIAAKEATATPA